MSRLGYLLGGALLGAAGLAAAAVLSENTSDASSSGSLSLDNVDALDAAGLAKRLNSYFFKAQAISSKCNSLTLESGDLCGPLELPDDGFFMRAGNAIVGKMTEISRGGKQDALSARSGPRTGAG